MAKTTIKKPEKRISLKMSEYVDLIAAKRELEKLEKEMLENNSKVNVSLSKEDQVIAERIEKTKHLLLVKGKEYVRNDDRLHNFRRAAEMSRSNMPRQLHGMVQKHIVSYYDMLDDIDQGKKVSKETIEEKLGDIIVYMHLQEVAIKEETENL